MNNLNNTDSDYQYALRVQSSDLIREELIGSSLSNDQIENIVQRYIDGELNQPNTSVSENNDNMNQILIQRINQRRQTILPNMYNHYPGQDEFSHQSNTRNPTSQNPFQLSMLNLLRNFNGLDNSTFFGNQMFSPPRFQSFLHPQSNNNQTTRLNHEPIRQKTYKSPKQPDNQPTNNTPTNDTPNNQPTNDTHNDQPINNIPTDQPTNDALNDQPTNDTSDNQQTNNTSDNQPTNDTSNTQLSDDELARLYLRPERNMRGRNRQHVNRTSMQELFGIRPLNNTRTRHISYNDDVFDSFITTLFGTNDHQLTNTHESYRTRIRPVMRSYTPVSTRGSNGPLGLIDLLIRGGTGFEFGGIMNGSIISFLPEAFTNIFSQNEVPIVLKKNESDKLENNKLSYNDLKNNNDDTNSKCTVCLEKYEDDDKDNKQFIKLPCKHIFHATCIMEWLKNYNYTCPVCRKECGEHYAKL